jgi:hypothetical protein
MDQRKCYTDAGRATPSTLTNNQLGVSWACVLPLGLGLTSSYARGTLPLASGESKLTRYAWQDAPRGKRDSAPIAAGEARLHDIKPVSRIVIAEAVALFGSSVGMVPSRSM